jgi:DNA-binding NtrC family response regulator
MKREINILIVDDKLQVRQVLEQVLEMGGYHVSSVGSAREALDSLRVNRVDLIISDIRMPEMSGYDLLKIVKRDYPDIAVVMMTGYGEAYSIKEALLLGADEYITKPFKGQELSLIIERICWRFLSGKSSVQIIPAKKTVK